MISMEGTENTEDSASSPLLEIGQPRPLQGRARVSRLDSISRFSEPPAPPPQQALPEKPDMPRPSPLDGNHHNFFKRNDPLRPGAGIGGSPTGAPSSQISSLVEALATAKKELDTHAARVKHLEDMLRQERTMRESAEERARRLEIHASFRPITSVTNSVEMVAAKKTGQSSLPETSVISTEESLQQRLQSVVAEMSDMKREMDQYQQRAEKAESDASETRSSLAEMVARLRLENQKTSPLVDQIVEGKPPLSRDLSTGEGTNSSSRPVVASKSPSTGPTGSVGAPSRLPQLLRRAMTTVVRENNGNGNSEMLAQTAPYASMLGAVLLGVGLMAYLNSWQKVER